MVPPFGCINNNNEEEYRGLTESFVTWCNNNHLKLNISRFILCYIAQFVNIFVIYYTTLFHIIFDSLLYFIYGSRSVLGPIPAGIG